MNIASNLKAVEEIKSGILSEVADLYKHLADYDEIADYDNIESSVSTIVAMGYILAKHLGISHSVLDNKICALLSIAAENGHTLETEFRDMSELLRHIRKRAA